MNRAGVLDDVRLQGFVPGDICWRRIDGSLIVKWNDSSQVKNPDALTVLPLNDLCKILLAHAERQASFKVKWNHHVTSIGQDESSAWIHARLPDESEVEIRGDYVCGCDGGNSQVRRTLFGNANFPGKTWNAQIVATNVNLFAASLHTILRLTFHQVYYPFEKFGYEDINFVIDPENYYMAARITRDGMWRVSYGENVDFTLQQVRDNQPKKFEVMLPGQPKPGEYRLLNCSPYRIHQRCAEKFRVGRVCLVADAAHLCNPFGGLGLTGGLVDAGGLADCLEGIATGQANEDVLKKYDEMRRQIYANVMDPISSSNFLRISSQEPEKTAQKDEFLALVRQANNNPAVKKQVDEVSDLILAW